MRILALLKPAPGKSAADFGPLIIAEEIAVWKFYREGRVRDMHFDAASLTASVLFEAGEKHDVEAALQTLPMVKAGLFTVELIEQGAWTPLEALFQQGVLQNNSAIDVVRGIYEAVARSDWDGVLTWLDPDIVFEQSRALPFAGVWRGHEGFQKLGEAIFRAWPNFSVEALSFAQTADVVLVVTRVKGSNAGAETSLDQTMIEYWRVANDRAIECRPFYFDPVGAAKSAAQS